MRGQDRFDPASLHARASGRSWWALRYHDGRLLHERERDWSQCPAAGRQRLRLYCPNGAIAELGGDGEQTGRLFQLKVALRHGALEAGQRRAPWGPPLPGRAILAHVIGRVHGLDGCCTLYAWEPPGPVSPQLAAWLRALASTQGGFTRLAERSGVPLPALAGVIRDGAPLSAGQVARLLASHGDESARGAPAERPSGRVPPVHRSAVEGPRGRPPSDGAPLADATCATLRRWCGSAQLVGPLQDNIHHMAYHQLGALCPEHLGLAPA